MYFSLWYGHKAYPPNRTMMCNLACALSIYILIILPSCIKCFTTPTPSMASNASFSIFRRGALGSIVHDTASTKSSLFALTNNSDNESVPAPEKIFEQFTKFLISHQIAMIDEIERIDGSGKAFSCDGWGAFSKSSSCDNIDISGGITRVLQGGDVVEKGACSLTVIRNTRLTKERAETISARQQKQGVNDEAGSVEEGDVYSAAALSVVLHTRNPFVPTFRSDVRIFLVKQSSNNHQLAWFGGGSDLTPYYLIDSDIIEFHSHLKSMCEYHFPPTNAYNLSYMQMKQSCDEYFYLPARSEHRGTGGIFFDDLPATVSTLSFVQNVAQGWMPSWRPIVERNSKREYTSEEKHWQCLRRGRYLEFNLLYDRGVKFGLANANPRVEGVMVSAPPMIAFDYNHVPVKGSEEARLIEILKSPKDWV